MEKRSTQLLLALALALVALVTSGDSANDNAWDVVISPRGERVAWQAEAAAVTRVCALDAFHFGVRFAAPKQIAISRDAANNAFEWELIAQRVDGWEAGAVVSSGPLEANWSDSNAAGQPDLDPHEAVNTHTESAEMDEERGLECEFDAEFCSPKLVGIHLPDIDDSTSGRPSLQAGHLIQLEFDQPTNRPSARTTEDIDRFISFTEYVGSDLTGTWSSDGRVLVVKVNELDDSKVNPVRELMEGLLHTSIRTSARDMAAESETASGRRDFTSESVVCDAEQSLRIAPPGVYSVRVTAAQVLAAHSPEFTVEVCDFSHLVLPPRDLVSSMGTGTTKMPSASFAVDGVLSHGGSEGFSLPHSSIRMENIGSWSLSFWVFLVQDSTGSFRTLFFNGDGKGEQRTPSAWWRPNDRRLVIRVSTTVNTDVGVDSSKELPLNQWLHMGFTFVNCSTSANVTATVPAGACPSPLKPDEQWLYSISFYLNGVLDTEARVHESVVANSGPLHMGKGPWTDGMQGFTSHLKVFPIPLSASEHRERFFVEKDSHMNYIGEYSRQMGNDPGSEVARARSATKKATTQISYLLQCFELRCNSNLNKVRGEVHGEDKVSSSSDAMSAPSNFRDLQVVAYRKASAAFDSCDATAFDLLVEAAELGHPKALRDTGDAYLYGSYVLPDYCPVSPEASGTITQDLKRAQQFLECAFLSGVLDAAKSLALLEQLHVQENAGGNPLAGFTTGLLHLSAASGRKDVFAMLGHRYHTTSTADSTSLEIAVNHYYHVAVEASVAFHELGKEPLHEMTRLYDSFGRDITVGERGDDDELIQFQKMRAREGDVAAMAAMGELYYWGARGVPRDQEQAYRYFERAAEAGHVNSQSAVAGMLLKGEGTEQDNTTAIKWYEKAAEKNHTRALNGLGFIHFHGSGGVPENKSLALEYFERAAANEEDGDSVFNAGYCHAAGLGTAVNVSRAMGFYDVAVRKFGHFDAIFELGKIWMNGVDGIVARDSQRAVVYLKAASQGGQWGRTMRKGFDLYVNNEFERAVVLYHEAQELGYPVATSNLAFLYDQKLLQVGDRASECQALRYLHLASEINGDKEVLVRIGDYHYYGLAGLTKDAKAALRWYSRASAEGVEAGAYNVGHMYEYGEGVAVNLVRARRYYDRVLELSSGSTEVFLVVRFALIRLKLRKWLQETPFESVLSSHSSLGTVTDTNETRADSALALDAAKNLLNNNAYVLLSSAITVLIASVGIWYFRR